MKTAVKTDIKKDLTTLYEITYNTGDFISDFLNAFIYNKSNLLEKYRSSAGKYLIELSRISADLNKSAGNGKELAPYVTVSDHLMKILKNLNRLYDLTERKINEKVLFPDMCLDETIYLLQRLTEILRPAADMILARNIFLKKYIEESQKSIERNATAYATMHENILITGERLPVASSIHVSILEAIKDIAWNVRKIAQALAK